MTGNDTQPGREPSAHWGTRAIAVLLKPVVWLLMTALIVLLIAILGAELVCRRTAAPQWAMGATILASPVAYVVLLRRCEASWANVASRLGYLAGGAVALTICAAVVGSNLLGAIDRGKQKRTIHDMRAIASAIDAYLAEHPAGARAESIEELNATLRGTYPCADAWSDPFLVRWDGAHYLLRSLGRDGELDKGSTASTYQPGATFLFGDDIVLEDGRFKRYPQGTQE